MPSRNRQRLFGLFFLLFGVVGTYYEWSHVLAGRDYSDLSLACPGFAVAGVGCLLFPVDPEGALEKYGPRPTFRQLPWVWQVITVAALIACVANYILIRQF